MKLAEREGFEPSVPVTQYARLAIWCLRPLGHLSASERRLFNIDRWRASRLRNRRDAIDIARRAPRPLTMRGGFCAADDRSSAESMEQVELILRIVDEVDAACAGHHGQPEQRACARGREQRCPT